ncbi:hypothetical protein BKA56DRAFT_677247 [Ilyonectria sp. MPI-CAGE-AT-0026]|nr:hypothetical protein BKA56DRAFT_677247 [Ilyonectria sp. MPI-CAGE-AT-0026]
MSAETNNTILAGYAKYGDECNIRLQPTSEKNWQDSVVLVWWDPDNNIGGFHRLGHEPNNLDGSFATLWSNLVTPSGIFKRTQSKPLREEDSIPGGGYGSGDGSVTVEFKDGLHTWVIDEPEEDLMACIVHRDTGPNVDCFPKKNAIADNFAAGHLDIPGTVSGTMTIKGKTFKFQNGLSIRDHGWGVRDWGSALLSHRWIVGTSGPDFSVFIVVWHSADDRYAKFGWVVRDNIITAAKSIDVVTYVEDDSLTNRGGKTELELVSGEKFIVEWTPVAKGFVSWYRGIACVDRLCSFKATGEGKVFNGFGDYESTSNIHAGDRKPSLLVNGVIDDGLTRE